MKKIFFFTLFFLLAVLPYFTCAKPPSIGSEIKRDIEKGSIPVSRAEWEQKWETVLAGAKKEEVVSVYALWRPPTRIALTNAFKEKYGIRVEFTPFSRGAELFAKVQAERRAGLSVVDVIGAGGGTLVATMKPADILGPIESFLILPEVLDLKVWRGGKFPFIDKDKRAIAMIAALQRDIVYNTDLVKKGEIASLKDLLKPQYQGKITINDPSVTGAGNAFLTLAALYIWNEGEARDFLSQLLKQQKAVIQRDNRLHIEEVARGKFSIGLSPLPDGLVEFLKIGAPIDVVFLKEGIYMTPAAGAMAVPHQLAHPKAATVFINWLLTKEGQTVFSQSFGNPGMRIDAPTEGIHPSLLEQPGDKLFLQTEDFILYQGKILSIAKEVIDEAARGR